MSRWGRVTKTAGVVAGTAAAGFGAVMAAERFAARLRPEPDSEAAEPLGELRGRELIVPSDDGMPLHVEINGPDDAPITVIFSHGYALNQDSWHYQRRDLAACARLVFWDQRGHGRSGPLAGPPVSIDRTGADLHAVIGAVTGTDRRVVLVGHSMGGMTIMALAARYPELFGAKIVGLVLIGTAAGGLSSPDGLVPWMPSPLRIMLQRAVPTVLRTAARGRRAVLVEHGRKASSEIEFLATRFLAFGDPWMSVTVTDFLGQIIRQAPVGVIAEFYSALLKHDAHDVPGVLSRVPVTVVVGDRDRLIPPQLGIDLAESIDGSRLVIVEGAGHAVILERPDVVNETISSMVAQVQIRAQAPAPRPVSACGDAPRQDRVKSICPDLPGGPEAL